MAEPTNDFPTTIGADATFKGQLEFEKGARLLGKFEGEINSGGELFVAQGATLDGDMKLGAIRIEGQVKGNIDAKTRVQLTSSARLEGDVQAQRLEVEEGAVLIGRCVVGVTDSGRDSKDRDTSTKEASMASSSVPMMNKPKPAPAPIPVGAKK
jgi:cytoskeletal protein CcmA (bactofilin family)